MNCNRISIFAHYDKDNIVDEYVFYYLKELKKVSNKIIFVTVSDINQGYINKLEQLDIEVIKRENIGYDFYSYKTGIERLNLSDYDELILCNDSVYGPIVSLEKIFEKMSASLCDFWGITASRSISSHLQSYFLVFKSNILHSNNFLEFWNNVEILENKQSIIERYEVGLSQFFFKNNYVGIPYINDIPYTVSKKDNIIRLAKRVLNSPYKIFKFLISPKRYLSAIKNKNINTSLFYWDKLLLEKKTPFLKKSLFINHQDSIENLERLKELQIAISSYPISLIINHLRREK